MKQREKHQLFEAFLQLGLSAQKAGIAAAACIAAFEPPRRIVVVEDFAGLSGKVVAALKEENERMKFGLDQENHPDGWYHKFDKPHGKRNLRSR